MDFLPSPLERLHHPVAQAAGVEWYVKRDDLYGPGSEAKPLQGNKVRKLKGHLAKWRSFKNIHLPILSFGGAYSNHLIALATAGRLYDIATIGVVRGEAVDNSVLTACQKAGMQLHFVSRGEYRQKHLPETQRKLEAKFGRCYIVPEGGSGQACQLGTGEILPEIQRQCNGQIDYFQLAAGTGGTAAGIINGFSNTKIEVFPVLKGDWMEAEIRAQTSEEKTPWQVIDGYHFGGYAKRPPTLLEFRTTFSEEYNIPLEPIYTAKLFYGVLDRIRRGIYARGSRLVTYHSGGVY